ncbi:matrix protein [Drosophila obscura sigmavirus 10A]|uniref:Matrix protein n=1 Tax=Drosophila obscura sigmavirus TaxID=948741 RepID=C8CJE9_9RHAB|nr:matrix protein [Drosophila obscura sigmavirus 10A]ACU65442.1 matrix protein [Drosophila obscura sigmavirus 10A]
MSKKEAIPSLALMSTCIEGKEEIASSPHSSFFVPTAPVNDSIPYYVHNLTVEAEISVNSNRVIDTWEPLREILTSWVDNYKGPLNVKSILGVVYTLLIFKMKKMRVGVNYLMYGIKMFDRISFLMTYNFENSIPVQGELNYKSGRGQFLYTVNFKYRLTPIKRHGSLIQTLFSPGVVDMSKQVGPTLAVALDSIGIKTKEDPAGLVLLYTT